MPGPRTAAVAIAWVSLLLGVCRVAGDTLTVLHTNGLEGRLRPGRYFDEERGGMARIVRLLRDANADGQALVLDGGNALGPDPISRMDRGRFFISLMDSAAYTAMVPGNHDLDYGSDSLAVRAREAPFAMLAANLRDSTGKVVTASHVVVERRGMRILLAGVMSPSLAEVLNPTRTAGVGIQDPGAALSQAFEGVADSVDLVIVLAHMPESEVVQLARGRSEVDLFVAGGPTRPLTKGGETHLVRLASGTWIASAPGRGAAVGRLDLLLDRGQGSGVTITEVRGALLPVDAELPESPQIRGLIDQQEWLFAREGQRPVAQLVAPVEDSHAFMAELARRAIRAEVGIVNYGALRPVRLHGSVRMSHIDTLVRYDDILVRVELTGKRLRQLVRDSESRQRSGQKLTIAGYDRDTHAIGGVPVEDGEVYRAATTGYLASGGDGYFGPAIRQTAVRHPELSMRGMAMAYLAAHPEPVAQLARRREAYRSWNIESRLAGSLSQVGLNDGAQQYGGVSLMTGRAALAWNTSLTTRLSRKSAASVVTGDVSTSYGRLRRDGDSDEAVDRVNLDLVYTRRRSSLSPYGGLSATTVWTAAPQQEHPLTLRGSAGVSARLSETALIRFGLGVERDILVDRYQAGLEVAPEARLDLPRGNAISSHGKLFFGAADPRALSMETYNSVVISVYGQLKATLDANLFLHWDDRVGETGLKSEIRFGLGYVWGGRWVPRGTWW